MFNRIVLFFAAIIFATVVFVGVFNLAQSINKLSETPVSIEVAE